MSKRRKKSGGGAKTALSRAVLDVFHGSPSKPLNYKQVSAALNLTEKEQRGAISQLLDELAAKGVLKQRSPGQYELINTPKRLEGTIEITKRGAGYVTIPGTENDIYIPPQQTGGAFTGDVVAVASIRRKGKKSEGKVVEVVQRLRTKFVGVVQLHADFAFVVMGGQKSHVDFFVALNHLNGAQNGDKVVVEFMDWPSPNDSPFGKVIEVLGRPGDNDVEMHAILAEFDLPDRFPKPVEDAAKKVSGEISETELEKRRDFRNTTTLTIDPVDAKDFDDALSLRNLENGNWEVGIHIADVSHYVTIGGTIDKEASERAFSVYLVDRVVPMLPERLSNELCSLRPDEDKLAFSAVFELTNAGKVVNEWFGKTVIRSNNRFTYEEAQELIEGADGVFKDEVLCLDRLAKIIRKNRIENGALAIESKEVRFTLDADGNPTGVVLKTSKDSNKLIEEFMLLANKRVATFLSAHAAKFPALYRVHDLPDIEKLKDLSRLLFGFDIRISFPSAHGAGKVINNTLAKIEDEALRGLIQKEAIKSMAKAAYSTDNIGHYGLLFSHYTHFTSPIRRFPDLLIHRILHDVLSGRNKGHYSHAELDKLCKHSSLIERSAINAERASVKFKQAQYLSAFIGEKFAGVVSGITEWGFFVELENYCEGLVHIQSLEDDYYYLDSKTRSIVGQNTNFEVRLGDQVDVRIKNADPLLKQVDLTLVNVIKPG